MYLPVSNLVLKGRLTVKTKIEYHPQEIVNITTILKPYHKTMILKQVNNSDMK